MTPLFGVLRYSFARRGSLTAAGFIALVLAGGAATADPPAPRSAQRDRPCHALTDLGPVSFNGLANAGLGVNIQGTVVGATERWDSKLRGFLYRKGEVTQLGTLGGTMSDARAINARGQAVGGAWTVDDAAVHAALFYQGKVHDLGTLDDKDPYSISFAVDINEFGSAAGNAFRPGGPLHATLWIGGKIVDLSVKQMAGTLGGPDRNSYADGINDWGVASGGAQDKEGIYHAVIWRNGKIFDLGALPGDSQSFGRKINNAGEVCGSSGSNDTAVLFRHGSIVRLGDLGGGFTWCEDVGDQGHAVGLSVSSDGFAQAVLWRDEEEGLINLNTTIPPDPGLLLFFASRINWRGQIAAYGTRDFNSAIGFLLTPMECRED